jgi:hypothetical protein
MIETRLKGFRLLCVSNREPFIHVRTPAGIRCTDPALRATGGAWIARGSGKADRVLPGPEVSERLDGLLRARRTRPRPVRKKKR